jgi:hypothetical protein
MIEIDLDVDCFVVRLRDDALARPVKDRAISSDQTVKAGSPPVPR